MQGLSPWLTKGREKYDEGLCKGPGRLRVGYGIQPILAFWPRGKLRRRGEGCLGFSGFGFEDERKWGNGDGFG